MRLLQEILCSALQEKDVVAIHGDCLDIMQFMCYNTDIPFFDACVTDMPYNQTRAKWDQVLPVQWQTTVGSWVKNINAVTKNKLLITTAAQPFTTDLINANRKNFRDALVWDKVRFSGPLNSKKRPLRQHEDVLIFYEHQPHYTPQMRQGFAPYSQKSKASSTSTLYGKQTPFETSSREGERYPISILTFAKVRGRHPTKKPTELYSWIIKSYTREKDVILDPFAGEFTTAIAAAKARRKCVVVERDKEFYEYGIHMLEQENISFVQLQCPTYYEREHENSNSVSLVHNQT